MDDVHLHWVRTVQFWTIAFVLVGLTLLAFWARRKVKVQAILIAWLGLALALDVVLCFFDRKALTDWRYWVGGAIAICVIAAPSALFSLLVGKNSAAHWVLLGAVLFAMLGALSVPLVSLFTVCGMGIDCL